MSFTFSGNDGLRISEKMKSSRSFIPCASGIPTTSYLSKAARMAETAGSGLGLAAGGLAGFFWAWLVARKTARRTSKTPHELKARRSLLDCAEDAPLNARQLIGGLLDFE